MNSTLKLEKELKELKSQFSALKQELETVKGKDILTIKELASWLNVSRKSLYRWKNDGVIPSYFLGGKLFFKRSEILAQIEAGKVVTH